jgi:hypothetical protein
MNDLPPTLTIAALVDQRLTLPAFHALAGVLGGHAFVKVVVERESKRVHFVNEHRYRFHSDYVGEQILGVSAASVDETIDRFNESVYLDPARRFYISTLTLITPEAGRPFFALETVEIDTMDGPMILDMMAAVARWLEPSIPLFFKPANHLQERIVAGIAPSELPRILSHELFSTATFLALHPGRATGRLRAFASLEAYREARGSLRWHDVLVMPRVPDDVPRVAGLINAERTTPLSHPNVLAHGWGIPNAIQIGILARIAEEKLDGAWVDYRVEADAPAIALTRIEPPATLEAPPWRVHAVRVDPPETHEGAIATLASLRMQDRDRYGTKAANLGELAHVLAHGSPRLIGYYRVPRPPRPHLLAHLARRLSLPAHEGALPSETELETAALAFLRSEVHLVPGIALPFALARAFFESSPAIQQGIGRLKMALELGAPQAESAALELARAVRAAKMSDALADTIDAAVVAHLGGTKSFVVRSSSNAEDLEGFSAAGVYESVTHVTSRARLLESVKAVWASLFSPRAVRLRADVGIALDDASMGVILQEEKTFTEGMGGVMVTSNPTAPGDFRDVYLNVSLRAVGDVVAGVSSPLQVFCNTVEGGSHTVSIGGAPQALDEAQVRTLERLALAGRLLAACFADDYTFSAPLDVEWIATGGKTYLVQARPYAG